jgi:iron complex transport system substrate-binding protein
VDARLVPAGPRAGAIARPILALLLAAVVAACSGASATPTPTTSPLSASPAPAATAAPTAAPTDVPTAVAEFPVTLSDDEGTKVTIAREPQKIVSLTPAATETLFALGLGDRVVGKAQDVDLYPPQAGPIPEVAVYDAVDVEKVTGLEPDLVIAGGNNFNKPEAITQLRSLGIPVVVEYAPDIATVLSDIELTGTATGTADEAKAITDRMRDEMATVQDAVKGLPTPRTYYELDATGAFYGPSDNSFLAEMLTMAGADPITTGSPDSYAIPAERLIAADPELILLADAKYGTKVEDVKKRPGWSAMTAVKDGDIRPIDDTTVTRPGPRLFLGLALLARTIHPDAPIPSAEPIPAAP